MSLDSWHVACQLPFMEVNMLISFKQKTPAIKVVQVYISKLNIEMTDILRQPYFPRLEIQAETEKS